MLNIHKTALYIAIENENIEIIKSLLANDKINVNIPYLINTKIFLLDYKKSI